MKPRIGQELLQPTTKRQIQGDYPALDTPELDRSQETWPGVGMTWRDFRTPGVDSAQASSLARVGRVPAAPAGGGLAEGQEGMEIWGLGTPLSTAPRKALGTCSSEGDNLGSGRRGCLRQEAGEGPGQRLCPGQEGIRQSGAGRRF